MSKYLDPSFLKVFNIFSEQHLVIAAQANPGQKTADADNYNEEAISAE